MDDLLTGTVADAAARLASRTVSARDLTEATLARIAAANPALNAVVELREEPALREADAADRATARGVSTGPLHGVPVTVKESIAVAGMRRTWGEPGAADHVSAADATVVARLRAAGAIVVGTTNAAAMLADFGQTANALYGATVNPWDPTRAPGGSSGGAAVAVVTGMAFLEYGSDLSGFTTCVTTHARP